MIDGSTTRYLRLSPTHVMKVSEQGGYKSRPILIELCNNIKEPLASWSILEQSNRIKTDFHMYTYTLSSKIPLCMIEASISEMMYESHFKNARLDLATLISSAQFYKEATSNLMSRNTSLNPQERDDFGN